MEEKELNLSFSLTSHLHILSHATKYLSYDVAGILLGTSSSSDTTDVVSVLPLAHTTNNFIPASLLNLGFAIAQQKVKVTPDLKIVGLYFANLDGTTILNKQQSSILNQILIQHKDPWFFAVTVNTKELQKSASCLSIAQCINCLNGRRDHRASQLLFHPTYPKHLSQLLRYTSQVYDLQDHLANPLHDPLQFSIEDENN